MSEANRGRGQPRRGYRRPKPATRSGAGRLWSRRAACFLWYFLSLRKKVLPSSGRQPHHSRRSRRVKPPLGKSIHSKFFALRSVPAGTTEVFRHSLPPFHSKHAIELLISFRTSRNASRPTHKTSQNFLPLFNKKSREPHVFHGTPCFLFYPRQG